MRLRSHHEFALVQALIETGHGDTDIARRTRIPRSTISAWRHGRGSTYHRRAMSATPEWRPSDQWAYCYLLGVYLGDGCLRCTRRGATTLVISLDSAYPALVAEVERAIGVTLAQVPVRRIRVKGSGAIVLQASHPALPHVFPQHGPGRKHEREIRLLTWQRKLTASAPQQLLRGLIHSDGCRTVNRFKVQLPSGRVGEYAYPRYFFSNLSPDIRRIFCEHCEVLGIRWTQSNSRNISISHRRSVAILDEFIGPKS
jgi:hypothetical protein